MKKFIVISILVFCCSLAQAATQISKVDFEDSFTDSYGVVTFRESTGLSASTILSYVASGHTGKAGRSSHNDTDDGGEDLVGGFDDQTSCDYSTAPATPTASSVDHIRLRKWTASCNGQVSRVKIYNHGTWPATGTMKAVVLEYDY